MRTKRRSFLTFLLTALALGIALRIVWDGYSHGSKPPWWAVMAVALIAVLIATPLDHAINRRHAHRPAKTATDLLERHR